MFGGYISGNSSAGRASVSQTEGRGFESRFPLFKISNCHCFTRYGVLPLKHRILQNLLMFRIISGIMQTPAFVPGHGRFYDQVAHLN